MVTSSIQFFVFILTVSGITICLTLFYLSLFAPSNFVLPKWHYKSPKYLIEHTPTVYRIVNETGLGNPLWYSLSEHHNSTPPFYTIHLFPEEDPLSDRICNQLKYMPKHGLNKTIVNNTKTILIWNETTYVNSSYFTRCPVQKCEIITDKKKASVVAMIFFSELFSFPAGARGAHQIYMLHRTGSPFRSLPLVPTHSASINWTSSYRLDSDIVLPYSKWRVYHSTYKADTNNTIDFAILKTKMIALVEDGATVDYNNRERYIKELQRYASVDIYGHSESATHLCTGDTEQCFRQIGNEYKFYLAFENSNCRDYITEKFFHNALGHDMIPIVMGARLDDYQRVAPEHSFIHVDEFGSPRELAEYLNLLNANDDLYNSYFKWKGTGEFVDTLFWCRICAMLHDNRALEKPRWKGDYNSWWSASKFCTPDSSWRTDLKSISDCKPYPYRQKSVQTSMHESHLCF